MDKEVILARHSLRQYSDKPLDNELIKKLNVANDLNLTLIAPRKIGKILQPVL